MGSQVDFRVLELLCARLCHELVSPVGAINNGVELLGEDDPDFVKEAIALIGQSARKAGQRLQFYRFAYGTAGGTMTGPAPQGGELVQGLLEGGKLQCEWRPEVANMPAEWQKLACNLLVLAAEALPRGGTIEVRPGAGGTGLDVTATGDGANLSPELRSALEGGADALTSRTVHAYVTGRLAEHIGATLVPSFDQPGTVVFTARPHG